MKITGVLLVFKRKFIKRHRKVKSDASTVMSLGCFHLTGLKGCDALVPPDDRPALSKTGQRSAINVQRFFT